MPRIKLDLPDRFHFTTTIPIRITDVNYREHLGNDAVLSLCHEARFRLLRSHGWTEMDIQGTGIIMSDAAIVFKSEAFYGDTVRIEVAVLEIGSAGCDMVYRMTNEATEKEIALVKTGIVFFDYTNRKPKPVPEAFWKAFS